ncbi:CLUMA_CG016425, isoform A [Clunio marinus]|uniref:CLUMA_CG016425, isoform A n=1 Tax=Clunio marinus TaxID=568069 RepID=A0A1J1IU97_9DIPT|nr:CLUMA_CG016425, isoform A [Clunio marinus]
MDSSQKLLFKIIFDFVLLACVALPILILLLIGQPYERGFFCNDESLMHPYNENTVSMTMLVSLGVCIPIVTIILIEIIRGRLNMNEESKRIIYSWNVPSTVQNLYKYIGIFLFGAACCQLITDIGKYSIGRFRPHFFYVCEPLMDGSSCSDPLNMNRYIEDFVCSNTQTSEKVLKDMRLSFPSGHASFAFYTMVFCALYLHSRMRWKGSKLFKHCIQFLLILAAVYCALSRISDYKHHWSDVLAGTVLGLTVALVVVYAISDLYKSHSKEKFEMLNQA